ncbi:hypothetical protein HDV04_001374 [Boothiomyces sp. JEL0838]|nr:hypothetical protein HDV04_001374 [Boothiomyces sp. JEL0838]
MKFIALSAAVLATAQYNAPVTTTPCTEAAPVVATTTPCAEELPVVATTTPCAEELPVVATTTPCAEELPVVATTTPCEQDAPKVTSMPYATPAAAYATPVNTNDLAVAQTTTAMGYGANIVSSASTTFSILSLAVIALAL